jgi:hypothetical protein
MSGAGKGELDPYRVVEPWGRERAGTSPALEGVGNPAKCLVLAKASSILIGLWSVRAGNGPGQARPWKAWGIARNVSCWQRWWPDAQTAR